MTDGSFDGICMQITARTANSMGNQFVRIAQNSFIIKLNCQPRRTQKRDE